MKLGYFTTHHIHCFILSLHSGERSGRNNFFFLPSSSTFGPVVFNLRSFAYTPPPAFLLRQRPRPRRRASPPRLLVSSSAVAGSVATVADEAPLLLTSPPSPPRLSTTASRHGRRSLVRGHCCCFFRSLPSRYISTAPPAPPTSLEAKIHRLVPISRGRLHPSRIHRQPRTLASTSSVPCVK